MSKRWFTAHMVNGIRICKNKKISCNKGINI